MDQSRQMGVLTLKLLLMIASPESEPRSGGYVKKPELLKKKPRSREVTAGPDFFVLGGLKKCALSGPSATMALRCFIDYAVGVLK